MLKAYQIPVTRQMNQIYQNSRIPLFGPYY